MNLKDKEPRELAIFSSIMFLIILVFSYVLFGIIGVRVAFGIVLMSLPFYLILDSFELAEGEKFVFSALFGLTIFPSLVYLLGVVVSFRIAIAIALAAFIIAALILRKHKSKK